MLTDKEYLLLCEIVSRGILNENEVGIGEAVRLLISKDNCNYRELLEEVLSSSNLVELRLKDSKIFEGIKVFVFRDLSENDLIVFAGDERFEGFDNQYIDEIIDFVKRNIKMENLCITGLEKGGIYAAYIASCIGAKAVVFGAPCLEDLSGDITNFVAENEPVGQYIENVVFVKQKIIDEIDDKAYFDILMFDDRGKAVEGEQTEYSKFCSWFYNNADIIDNKVWEIFFNIVSEDEALIDKDIYLLFLRASELNEGKIKVSLNNVVKHIENEIEINIKIMESELEKTIFNIDEENTEDQICEIAKNTSLKVIDTVKINYRSVETILMGVELLSLDSKTIDCAAFMEQFAEEMDNILNRVEQRIIDILTNSRNRYLDMLSNFSELEFDND